MTKYVIFKGSYGGADSLDFMVPRDAHGNRKWLDIRRSLYDQFKAVSPDYARDEKHLRPLSTGKNPEFQNHRYGDGVVVDERQFGMPLEHENAHALYQQGDLAIIANVGPLVGPVTAADWRSGAGAVPAGIQSHNFQQRLWASGSSRETPMGWMARIRQNIQRKTGESDEDNCFAGLVMGLDPAPLRGSRLSPLTIGGNETFKTIESGLTHVSRRGSTRDKLIEFVTGNLGDPGHNIAPELTDKNAAYRFVREVLMDARAKGDTYARAMAATVNDPQGNDADSVIDAAVPLAGQSRNVLRAIARFEDARGLLNNPGTVFFEMSSPQWDDHARQAGAFNTRVTVEDRIQTAIAADNDDRSLARELKRLGVWDRTVIINWSDFGRTMVPNTDGTDHGWGGNVFVMGGAVKGGRIYHNGIPEPDLNHPQVGTFRGVWVPTLSVEQYFGAVGRWLGLTPDELRYGVGGTAQSPTDDAPFPTIGAFPDYPGTSEPYVPFLPFAL